MDRLVVALLNSSLDAPDPLETSLGTARWWSAAGPSQLPAAPKPRFDAALGASLRRLREALLAALDGQTGPLPAVFRGDSSDAILFEVAHAIRVAQSAGMLRRVRTCGRQACGRYFRDETKNGSRRWCSLRCMERARAPRRRTISP